MVHSDTVEHAKVRLLVLASRCVQLNQGCQQELVSASETYAKAIADRCGTCLGRGFASGQGLWGYTECASCKGTGKRADSGERAIAGS